MAKIRLNPAALPPHLRDQIPPAPPRKRRGVSGGGLETPVKLAAAAAGLPPAVPEHRFHPDRMWRFDWAWPDWRIGVEYQGLMPSGPGGHQTMKGVKNDTEKLTEAALHGWLVVLVTVKTVPYLAAWVCRAASLRRASGVTIQPEGK